MSKSYLRRLRKKHEVIDRKIAKKLKASSYDPAKMGELEKLKQSVSDQIERIEAVTGKPVAAS